MQLRSDLVTADNSIKCLHCKAAASRTAHSHVYHCSYRWLSNIAFHTIKRVYLSLSHFYHSFPNAAFPGGCAAVSPNTIHIGTPKPPLEPPRFQWTKTPSAFFTQACCCPALD